MKPQLIKSDIYDQFERRCPKLGHPVKFVYCRICEDENYFCQKVADCWWEFFDITDYLKNKLPEDKFKTLAAAKPKAKITSLIELIAQAKKNSEQ